MRLLKTTFHPEVTKEDIAPSSSLTLGTRHTTRAIVLRGETILLLYTKRYDDYSLPGGGIDPGEDYTSALRRELKEETSATGIHNIAPFAVSLQATAGLTLPSALADLDKHWQQFAPLLYRGGKRASLK